MVTVALFAAPSTLFNPNSEAPKNQPKIEILKGEKDMIVPKSNSKRILDQWIKKNDFDETHYKLQEEYLDHPLLTAKQLAEKLTKLSGDDQFWQTFFVNYVDWLEDDDEF